MASLITPPRFIGTTFEVSSPLKNFAHRSMILRRSALGLALVREATLGHLTGDLLGAAPRPE
jgi:hypothetical protein